MFQPCVGSMDVAIKVAGTRRSMKRSRFGKIPRATNTATVAAPVPHHIRGPRKSAIGVAMAIITTNSNALLGITPPMRVWKMGVQSPAAAMKICSMDNIPSSRLTSEKPSKHVLEMSLITSLLKRFLVNNNAKKPAKMKAGRMGH